MSDDQPTVRDNPNESRFELYLGDELTGQARYVRRGGRIFLRQK